MSFTLIHHKNGKEIPIKMSIWDAFRGVPDPKPRKPKLCSCCGKNHVRDGGKIVNSTNGDASNNKTGGANSTSEKETFTAKQDAALIEMKKNGKSWNEILEALGKTSKAQVTDYYKELMRNAPKSDQDKKNEDEKRAIGEKKRAENLAHKDDSGKGGKKKRKGKDQADNKKGDEKKTERSTTNTNANSDFKGWADSFEEKKWVAIAAKHFDKTGERIPPEEAKQRAQKK